MLYFITEYNDVYSDCNNGRQFSDPPTQSWEFAIAHNQTEFNQWAGCDALKFNRSTIGNLEK